MFFLAFIHTFDTFLLYSNIQIVETLTISPPHKKIYGKAPDASGALPLEDFHSLRKKRGYGILKYKACEYEKAFCFIDCMTETA